MEMATSTKCACGCCGPVDDQAIEPVAEQYPREGVAVEERVADLEERLAKLEQEAR